MCGHILLIVKSTMIALSTEFGHTKERRPLSWGRPGNTTAQDGGGGSL